MNKKYSFIILLGIMALSVSYTNSVQANLNNITPGDTLYYSVSQFSLPLVDLIPASSTGGIDLSKVQLDLTGSKIGIKIMDINASSGNFLINSYAILNKPIVVPFPAGTSTNITDIFGNALTIPAGVGIGLGVNIPGSDMINLIADNTTGLKGLPIYIEPTLTTQYTALFNGIGLGSGSNLTISDTSSLYTVKFATSQTNVTGSISLSWFKTGSYPGVFSTMSANFQIMNSTGDWVNIALAISFQNLAHNPLPAEVRNMQTQTFKIQNIGFDLSTSGLFQNILQINQTEYNQVRSELLGLKGTDFLKYQFNNVHGEFYNTSIYVMNPSTSNYDFSGSSWFNGFIGQPTSYDPTCLLCNNGMGSIAIVPTLAPGITPDYDMWTGSLNTMQSLSNFVAKALTTSSTTSYLLSYGFTIDQIALLSQLRQDSNYKYFYGSSNIGVSYDASKALLSNRPSNFDGTEKGNLGLTATSYSAYTNTGLLAGLSFALNVSLSVQNINYYNNGTKYNGNVNLGLLFTLQNDGQTATLNPSSASVVTGSFTSAYSYTSTPSTVATTSSGTSIVSSPGFDLLPLFISVGVIVIVKKYKFTK